MSFALGTSRNPGIIVARTPVSRASWKTVGQLRADESASRSQRRAASYAANRLVAIPRGVPMYAVGHSQMLRGEVKFFDCRVATPVEGNPYGLFTAAAPPSGHEPATAFTGITELNCVQQGATAFNRIGTKIMIKSISLNACLSINGTQPNHVVSRVMLVYDRQPNGAFPLFSALLSDNISTAPSFNSQVNMANRSRFVILRDQYFELSEGGQETLPIKFFVKTKLETQFGANAGTIGDITTGAIYLVAYAQYSGATNYITLHEIQSRIRYFD